MAGGQDAIRQWVFPFRFGGRGSLASSRIKQQLDFSGPLQLPGGRLDADGDTVPSNAPMRISLVSPGFPPQLGGVEVVVGSLADALCAHGHRVTVYAQRPR